MNTVEQEFLKPNPFSRPQRKLRAVKGVVIHYTANPGAGARANRDYFNTLDGMYASAHYIVGLSGEIIQCLPLDEMAYHVGAAGYKLPAISALSDYPNNCTIGIEMCINGAGELTGYTYTSTVALTAFLCNNFSLPVSQVFRHYDVTGKLCPKMFVDEPKRWLKFLVDVGKVMKEAVK